MHRAKVLGMAIMLSASLCAHAANIPGRVFFTVSQRASLDAARNANQHVVRPASSAAPVENEPTLSAPGLSLNGIVRSEGRTQLLINNQIRDARPGEVLQDGSARVANQRGRSVDIKVGQRLNPYTGKVESGTKKTHAEAPPEQREIPQR